MAASSGRMEILTPGERRLGFIGSFLVTLLIVVAVVMATLFFAVRTAGGAAFISDRLSRCVGTGMTIERARIGWPYALVIDGLSTKEYGELTPGFKAQSLRISFHPGGWLCLDVHRGELHLVQDKRGEWMPTYFARLGDLPAKNIRHIARLTSPFRDRVKLKVADSIIRWTDHQGKETASVAGLYFVVLPVSVPDRRMSYCRMSVYSMAVGAVKTTDIEREWLMSEMDSCLMLRGSERHGTTQAGPWFSSGESDDGEEASKRTD